MHYILSSPQDAKETKSEIRISKSETKTKNQIPIAKSATGVWNFVIFEYLKLFRISDFEFRICNRACAWRPCAFAASHFDLVAALRVASFAVKTVFC